MMIQRDNYLNQIKSFAWDGQIKVITGIRRCGKSYLLRKLYQDYLISKGVNKKNIISIELDTTKDIKFRNPLELSAFVRNIVENSTESFYLFIDEIQLCDEVSNPFSPNGEKIKFYDALNDLKEYKNLDIYVTGSNSKMLSSDIISTFRGRGDEIRLHPLSFSEYYSAVGGDKYDAFDDYCFYGGMPLVLSRPDEESKMQYLKSLFSETYIKDIVERNKIKREDVLSNVIDFLSSSIGSLTNPTNVTNAINSMQKLKSENIVAQNTVKSYMNHLEDAFLFSECKRYDVKGKSYFEYPNKYYCEDIGLRNARIGFRQQEITHIMENIIYNELIIRRCSVDIGIVYSMEKNRSNNSAPVAREIDFVATKGGIKKYIQSAYAMETEEKIISETKPFSLTGDSFPKIIVRHDIRKRWYDDDGVLNIGIIDFLLDDSIV